MESHTEAVHSNKLSAASFATQYFRNGDNDVFANPMFTSALEECSILLSQKMSWTVALVGYCFFFPLSSKRTHLSRNVVRRSK